MGVLRAGLMDTKLAVPLVVLMVDSMVPEMVSIKAVKSADLKAVHWADLKVDSMVV